MDKDYAGQMPQIPGAASHASPPKINLEDYETMGMLAGGFVLKPAHERRERSGDVDSRKAYFQIRR